MVMDFNAYLFRVVVKVIMRRFYANASFRLLHTMYWLRTLTNYRVFRYAFCEDFFVCDTVPILISMLRV